MAHSISAREWRPLSARRLPRLRMGLNFGIAGLSRPSASIPASPGQMRQLRQLGRPAAVARVRAGARHTVYSAAPTVSPEPKARNSTRVPAAGGRSTHLRCHAMKTDVEPVSGSPAVKSTNFS